MVRFFPFLFMYVIGSLCLILQIESKDLGWISLLIVLSTGTLINSVVVATQIILDKLKNIG